MQYEIPKPHQPCSTPHPGEHSQGRRFLAQVTAALAAGVLLTACSWGSASHPVPPGAKPGATASHSASLEAKRSGIATQPRLSGLLPLPLAAGVGLPRSDESSAPASSTADSGTADSGLDPKTTPHSTSAAGSAAHASSSTTTRHWSADDGSSSPGLKPGSAVGEPAKSDDIYSQYRRVRPCAENLEPGAPAHLYDCQDVEDYGCRRGKVLLVLQGFIDGYWESIGVDCLPAEQAYLGDQVSMEEVVAAFDPEKLPRPSLHVQPSDTTLVQLDTVFWATVTTKIAPLRINGHRVELHIQPVKYHWQFGDGTTRSSTSPGAPYPDLTISHKYGRVHAEVLPQVSITWEVAWRDDAGIWRRLPISPTTTSSPVPLRVTEAVRNLTQ